MKRKNIVSVIKNFILILIILFCLYLLYEIYISYIKSKEVIYEELKIEVFRALEEAYFDGQRDAINNDIRIKLNEDSVYIWTKSPWDDTCREPIFIPTRKDSKHF